jgi:hypothetical protein
MCEVYIEVLLEDYRLIVERRSASSNESESYAGGSAGRATHVRQVRGWGPVDV